MDKFVAAVVVLTLSFALIAVVSMFPTVLWYCFDDRLAQITGMPVLGELPLTFVWPACLFLGSLFRGSSVVAGQKKK